MRTSPASPPVFTRLRVAAARLRSLFSRSRADGELDEEMCAHLLLLTERFVAQGMQPHEAAVMARRQFGNPALLQQRHREMRSVMFLSNLGLDLRYTLRALRRDRNFSLVAVLILALGMGANIVVFSVVNTILLRPLPLRAPERLVWIAPDSGHNLSATTYSADAYDDLRLMNRSYEDVTGYYAFSTADNLKLQPGGNALQASRAASQTSLAAGQPGAEPRPVTGMMVAGNFFHVLGVEPQLGRAFTADETRTGGSVVLLADAFWKQQFGQDRGIVGKTIRLSGRPTVVIGVMPETFDFGAVFAPGTRVDLFTPQGMDEIRDQGNTLSLVGRLKPGVSVAQAQSEAVSLFPKFYWSRKAANSNHTYSATPILLQEHVSGALRRSLLTLWGAVGLILLIVCVNLSNLLLARAATRSKEFALRISLGAGRGRLVRQLLIESMVLSGAGAMLGLVLAYGATFWLAHQGSVALPLISRVRVDGTALVWTLAITVAVALLFGLAPALRISSTRLQDTLKDSGPGMSYGRRQDRLRTILVITEVALACVLLVSSGLLLRSFLRVLDIDLGFQPSQAAAIKLDYDDGGDEQKRGAILANVLHQVSAVPGVEAAGVADNLPLERNRSWHGPAVKGKTYRNGEIPGTFVYVVSPGYLAAMGMRVLGRDFGWSDNRNSELVMVLNQAAARALWPEEDPVGRMATLQGQDIRVIGVVADVHESNVEGNAGWQMYLPATQGGWGPEGAELVIRSKLSPAALAPSVMRVLRSINPGQPASALRPVQSIVDHATSPRRFFAILVSIFAGLGLLLASLGIYGVISYSVTRQTQEIGIRMALGATRERVQMSVIGNTLRMAMTGVVIGTIASLGMAQALRSLLFGTEATDPVTFLGMAALLTAVAFAAGYLPARRASRINPSTALRSQ